MCDIRTKTFEMGGGQGGLRNFVFGQSYASPDVYGTDATRRCRAYIFPVVINVPIDVSVHAQ